MGTHAHRIERRPSAATHKWSTGRGLRTGGWGGSKFETQLCLRLKTKIKITLPQIRPKTTVSEGKRQSGPSLGTLWGSGGDKEKHKKRP